MVPTDDAMRLVHLLRAVSVEMELGRADFARVHRLHGTDVQALIHLLDASRADVAATPSWLADQLGMQSAATTAVIDRLERAGHVLRVRDSPDRRRVRLVVTEEAVALGWSFFGPLLDAMVRALTDYSPAELDTIEHFLVTMRRLAEQAGAG